MRTSVWTVTIVMLFLAAPPQGWGQSAASGLFVQANAAYEDGRYGEAIGLYEKTLSSGMVHGVVLYNLGNAYFKDNQLGRAILSYERAHRLLPRDTDVAANLDLARELVVDKMPLKPSSWLSVLTWLARSLNSDELTWLTFILYLMTAALVIVLIWTRRSGVRSKLLAICLVCGFLLVVAAASFWGNIYQQRAVSWAIVVTSSVDARSGPDPEYTKIFTIHEGTKVRVRQDREGWYLISLPTGLGGWVPTEAVEII